MPDFAYRPDFLWAAQPEYKVLRTKFENNVEQRRLKTSTKLRKFKLEFKNRRTAEMSAVNAFFDSKYGSLTSFSISIDGADVTGIIVPETFNYVLVAPGVYTYSFDFEEVVT